jgi:four helix bundle protein
MATSKAPHHSLIAWQRADDLFIKAHLLARTFPQHERFELGSQLRRSSFSVAANIAEGFGRPTGKERTHFLRIAAGSLSEVGYCFHAAHRLGYVSAETLQELESDVRRVAAPLRGLIDSLVNRNGPSPAAP